MKTNINIKNIKIKSISIILFIFTIACKGNIAMQGKNIHKSYKKAHNKFKRRKKGRGKLGLTAGNRIPVPANLPYMTSLFSKTQKSKSKSLSQHKNFNENQANNSSNNFSAMVVDNKGKAGFVFMGFATAVGGMLWWLWKQKKSNDKQTQKIKKLFGAIKPFLKNKLTYDENKSTQANLSILTTHIKSENNRKFKNSSLNYINGVIDDIKDKKYYRLNSFSKRAGKYFKFITDNKKELNTKLEKLIEKNDILSQYINIISDDIYLQYINEYKDDLEEVIEFCSKNNIKPNIEHLNLKNIKSTSYYIEKYKSLIDYDFKSISNQDKRDIIKVIKEHYELSESIDLKRVTDKIVTILDMFEFLNCWGIKINLSDGTMKKIANFNYNDFYFYKGNKALVSPDSYINDIYSIDSIDSIDSNLDLLNFKFLKNPAQIKDFIKQDDNFSKALNINKNIFKFCRIINILEQCLPDPSDTLNISENKKQKIIELLKKIDGIYEKLPNKDFDSEELEKEIKELFTSDNK